jgi:hypothetical protein
LKTYIEEEVYIEIFPIFDSIRGINRMYRLRKVLYKLKQSPHTAVWRFAKKMMFPGIWLK